jgi:hypothetical protein
MKVTISQEYDWEPMDSLVEQWEKELGEYASEVAHKDGSHVSFEFDLPPEIAERMKVMFKIFFGLDSPMNRAPNYPILIWEEEGL